MQQERRKILSHDPSDEALSIHGLEIPQSWKPFRFAAPATSRGIEQPAPAECDGEGDRELSSLGGQ